MKPVIQSVKHITQHNAGTVAQGAIGVLIFVDTVKDYAGVVNEVPVGSLVKAIYVEMWCLSDAATFGNVSITLEKVPNDSTKMTTAQSTNLDAYPNKHNILYTTQGLTAPSGANPTPFLRGWFKIPKGKQRMALGDQIVLNISSIVQAIEFCGLSIYKSYT